MKKLSTLEKFILADSLMNSSSNNTIINKHSKNLYSKASEASADSQVSAAAKKLPSNLKTSSDLSSFEAGFNSMIGAFEILAWVPSPVGNPFSTALAGNSAANGDYIGALINIIGSIPAGKIFGKGIMLAREAPKWLPRLINIASKLGIQQKFINVIKWLATSIKHINIRNAAYYVNVPRVIGTVSLNEIIAQAEPGIRKIGNDLESLVNSLDKTPKKLVTSPNTNLGDVYDYEKISTENLKKMLANPTAYELNDSQISKVQQELDDREVDEEVGSERN